MFHNECSEKEQPGRLQSVMSSVHEFSHALQMDVVRASMHVEFISQPQFRSLTLTRIQRDATFAHGQSFSHLANPRIRNSRSPHHIDLGR